MRWQIRVLFYVAMAVVAIALVIGAINKYQQPAQPAGLLAASDVSAEAEPFEQATSVPDAFDESSAQTPALPAAVPPIPKEDLLLTGLSGLSAKRCAFFVIRVAGETDTSFMLREGEQNEWLEVLSIDPPSGTVKAILKKPVVRIRNVGVEAVLSFKMHGAAR